MEENTKNISKRSSLLLHGPIDMFTRVSELVDNTNVGHTQEILDLEEYVNQKYKLPDRPLKK